LSLTAQWIGVSPVLILISSIELVALGIISCKASRLPNLTA